jgi:hypothetical protein
MGIANFALVPLLLVICRSLALFPYLLFHDRLFGVFNNTRPRSAFVKHPVTSYYLSWPPEQRTWIADDDHLFVHVALPPPNQELIILRKN